MELGKSAVEGLVVSGTRYLSGAHAGRMKGLFSSDPSHVPKNWVSCWRRVVRKENWVALSSLLTAQRTAKSYRVCVWSRMAAQDLSRSFM